MATKVVMPKLGLVMKEGLLVLWHREEGEDVQKGDDLLEIESDKVTTLIEAPASGTIRKIIAFENEVIPCGKAIAVIAEDGEDVPELESWIAETRAVAVTREEWERRQSQKPKAEEPKAEAPQGEVRISPAARKLAKEYGVDLARVKGSGPDGRIVQPRSLAEQRRIISELISEEIPEAVERIERPAPKPKRQKAKSVTNQPLLEVTYQINPDLEREIAFLAAQSAVLEMSRIMAMARALGLQQASNDDEEALMAILAVVA